MNYFSDYLQMLGNDFEIAATEFDLIIVKENSELMLMGMVEQLKALEKPLKEGISKGEFSDYMMTDGWSCCISKTGSFHLFCYSQPILNLSFKSFSYLLGLVTNHYKGYTIKFEDQLTGQLCECDSCYSDEYTWNHLNLFEKRGLKIKLGDVVTGEMLLKMLKIQEDLFRCLHHFRPKRLEELCLARLNEQEKKNLPESVHYSCFRGSMYRDIPYLWFNSTAFLVHCLRPPKEHHWEIDNEHELWNIFPVFLKHKGFVISKRWI